MDAGEEVRASSRTNGSRARASALRTVADGGQLDDDIPLQQVYRIASPDFHAERTGSTVKLGQKADSYSLFVYCGSPSHALRL